MTRQCARQLRPSSRHALGLVPAIAVAGTLVCGSHSLAVGPTGATSESGPQDPPKTVASTGAGQLPVRAASPFSMLPSTPHPFRLVHPWFERVVDFTDEFPRRTLSQEPAPAIDWRLDDISSIGGHDVTVAGAPRVVDTPVGRAVEFDGIDDGIFLEVNPLAGMERFTVEVLFEPAADGPPEQRFLHFEEAGGGKRALVETRMLPGGRWCLDTFLKDGDAALTLIDRERTHEAGRWHVAALVYDGARMSHYVDGALEVTGTVAFRPLAAGRTSIGVRLSKVYWFKGRIARLRITPEALAPAQLMRPSVAHGAERAA